VCVSVYAADFPIFVHFFFSWPLFDGEHEAYRSRIWILCSTLVSVAHVPGRQVSSFVVVICGEEKKKKLKCYGSSRARLSAVFAFAIFWHAASWFSRPSAYLLNK